MLSQKARYALRALTALAELEPGAQAQIAEIADEARVPRKFLEQILLDLKKRGLVHSTRGKLGGYTLGRPASEIELAEVIRTIDGPLALSPCASRMAYRKCDDCLDADTCPIRKVLARSARRHGRDPREPQRCQHDRKACATSQNVLAQARLIVRRSAPQQACWVLCNPAGILLLIQQIVVASLLFSSNSTGMPLARPVRICHGHIGETSNGLVHFEAIADVVVAGAACLRRRNRSGSASAELPRDRRRRPRLLRHRRIRRRDRNAESRCARVSGTCG